MSVLRTVARSVRHLPGLERAEPLWRALRGPYQRLLDPAGRGVSVSVGKTAAVRIPAEFAAGSWERHEPEAVAAFAHWVRGHPGALVLDIGCSVGIYSAVALFAEPRTDVVAFDGDLPSLAATRRLCAHAPGDRLRVVFGFVTDTTDFAHPVTDAARMTEHMLDRQGIRGDPGTTRYASLLTRDAGATPRYRIDDLFAAPRREPRPVLVKCDVEGAELRVLRGASAFLREVAPALCLSVHPDALRDHGDCASELAALLDGLGYRRRLLAVDHEEHWWCEAGT